MLPFRLPASLSSRLTLRRVALPLFLALSVLSSPTQAASDDALSEGLMLNVVSLASSRLALARSVAQWKWHNKQPIDDPQREAILLDGLMKLAPNFGMDPAFAEAFFRDQFAASKEVQNALFAQWRQGNPPPAPDPSSFESARGEIYRISQAMLTALVRVEPIRSRSDCPILLSQAVSKWTTQLTTLDAVEKSALPTALGHVCSSGGVGGTA